MVYVEYKPTSYMPIRDFTGAPYVVQIQATGLVLLHPDNVEGFKASAAKRGIVAIELKGNEDAATEQATRPL